MSRPLLVGLGACAALVLLGLALQLTSHPRDVGAPGACASLLSPDGGALAQEFAVHAGFFQFYLSDLATTPPSEDATFWSGPARARHLASAPGILGIQVPVEGDAQVPVELLPAAPAPDLTWEHVVEGPLAVRSGKLAVRGCPDSAPLDPCLALGPGDYRVRISTDGWQGGEAHYLVQLWPSAPAPINVLREAAPPPAPPDAGLKPPAAPGR